MNGRKNRSEDNYATIKVSRSVWKRFTRAVEDWYGKRIGYIGPTAEEAIDAKTEELLAKIEARDGKG